MRMRDCNDAAITHDHKVRSFPSDAASQCNCIECLYKHSAKMCCINFCCPWYIKEQAICNFHAEGA